MVKYSEFMVIYKIYLFKHTHSYSHTHTKKNKNKTYPNSILDIFLLYTTQLI